MPLGRAPTEVANDHLGFSHDAIDVISPPLQHLLALLFSADTVPMLRALSSPLEGGHDVQFSPIESLMTKGAKDLMEATSDKEDKDWLGIGLDAGEVAGDTLGIPGTHQAVKMARYRHRANEGKIDAPSAYGALVGGR